MRSTLLSKSTRVRRLFGPLVIAVMFYFIARYLADNAASLLTIFHNPNYFLLLASLVLYLIYFCARAFGWHSLGKNLGIHLPIGTTFYIWTLSESIRYIPGTVWSVYGRVHLLKKEGVTAKIAFTSWVLEMAAVVFSSGAVASLFMVAAVNGKYVPPLLIGLFVFYRLCGSLGQRALLFLPTRYRIIVPELPSRTLLYYSIGWVCFGLAGALLASSFLPMTPNRILLVAGISVIAWLLGYISFITPMGLGVREAVFVFLASGYLAGSAAAFISIAARVWLVVCEVLFLAVILVIRLFGRYSKK